MVVRIGMVQKISLKSKSKLWYSGDGMNDTQNKKIVVITGASRGLGRAIAKKLASPESILVLCSRDIKKLKKVYLELKNEEVECYAYRVDVSKKKSVIKFFRMVLKKLGKIDILINNAGAIHKKKLMEKITDKEFELCMKTNFESVFYTLREIIPAMKKRKSGTIISISSTTAKRGNPDFAAYSASKFAVTGLMQSAARSLDDYGIRCLTIFPSGIRTDMRKYILGADEASTQQSPDSVAEHIKNTIENVVEFPNGSEIVIRDGQIMR